MATQEQGLPWSDLEAKFLLHDVRIVATFSHDGGAIVELLEKLECIEGRHFTFGGEDSDRESQAYLLKYRFAFGIPGVPDPLASECAVARVVVTGRHTNGKRVEIRGTGWLGYDNDGNIEGHFEKPPVMITEATEFPPPAEEDEWTDAEFQRHLNCEYPMPKQFEDALLRVPDRSNRDDLD
jgi:hypothetical protein